MTAGSDLGAVRASRYRGNNDKAAREDEDAPNVFESAVLNDPKSPTAWFGKNAGGLIYRFSLSATAPLTSVVFEA